MVKRLYLLKMSFTLPQMVLKWWVTPKKLILPIYTQPHVIPNIFFCLQLTQSYLWMNEWMNFVWPLPFWKYKIFCSTGKKIPSTDHRYTHTDLEKHGDRITIFRWSIPLRDIGPAFVWLVLISASVDLIQSQDRLAFTLQIQYDHIHFQCAFTVINRYPSVMQSPITH